MRLFLGSIQKQLYLFEFFIFLLFNFRISLNSFDFNQTIDIAPFVDNANLANLLMILQ